MIDNWVGGSDWIEPLPQQDEEFEIEGSEEFLPDLIDEVEED